MRMKNKFELKEKMTNQMASFVNVDVQMYFDNPFSRNAGQLQVGVGTPIT